MRGFPPRLRTARLHCPPSLMLEEQFQDEESAYAAKGTAGHAMAEHLIKKYLKQRTRRPVSDYYSDELLEAVDEYVSFIQGEIEEARRVCRDPVFTVDDLLPHLAGEQSKKSLGDGITGEQLNLLVGSRPFKDDEGSNRVKLAILDILNEKYGIVEADFISAELEVVPAFRACDIGFDRSLIGAYGQDDRVCAYACFAALMDIAIPKHTAVCMLADKEEIGSTGVSGMKGAAFDTFMSDLCDAQRVPLKACYEHSFCLSADVTAAFEPNFPEVYERANSSFINYGMGFCKYTGSRGKGGASDASAEVVGFVRRTMDAAGVIWQMAELGKVDAGGGGTVAAYMAERNIDTLDAGVPVLSMHAPFETVGKLDCYMTFKGMKAVFEAV